MLFTGSAHAAGDYFDSVKKAAEQGNADAQYNLGGMYADGEGVTQDYAEAVRWYRQAAEQGLASAQYNLGGMYTIGDGVPEDDAEAVRWYRKAAEQEHASAQYNLGVMYTIGDGVPEDDAEAVPLVPQSRGTGKCLSAVQSWCYVRQWRWRTRRRHTSLRLDQYCIRKGHGEFQKCKRNPDWRNDSRRDCRGAETFTQILGSLRSRLQYTIGFIRFSTCERAPRALPDYTGQPKGSRTRKQ